MISDNFKARMALLSVLSLLVLILAGIICLVFTDGRNRYDPLQYCIWEIQKHEGYDCEFSYFYDRLQPEKEIQKEADKGCILYAYYITTFTDDRKGEWYCFVEANHSSIFFGGHKPREIVAIDCDLAFETLYEVEECYCD